MAGSDQVKADIRIRLLPRSSREEVVGREGDIYKIKVTSPPVDGKANRALISLLSKKLGRPKRSIEIIAGDTSRMKLVRVNGLSSEKVSNLLDVE